MAGSKVAPREPDPNVFDLQTHKFNARGTLEGKNTYRLFSVDGVNRYERPVGSGNLWADNNEPAGRVTVVKDARGRSVGKTIDPDAKHKEYKPIVSASDKAQQDLMEAQASIEQLQKELDAIKAEQAVKMTGGSKRVSGTEEFQIDSAGEAAESEIKKGVSPSIKTDSAKAAVKDAEQAGKAPLPGNVHAERAAAEAERLAGKGQGLAPTPANVHAERAAKEAKK